MQDLTGKITGSTLTAAEWNQLPSEIQNIITDNGITLSSLDLDQLGKALANIYSGPAFWIDTGVADAYVADPVGSQQLPTVLNNGLRIVIRPGFANTATAPTINVASLGVKTIKREDGSAIAAGDLADDRDAVLRYDGTDWLLSFASLVAALPDASTPRGYIDGMVTSLGTDDDHDVDFGNGSCRVASVLHDAGTLKTLTNSSTFTKQIDATWAQGTDAGGLADALALAGSTWYHMFALGKASNGAIDFGFDTDVSAANLLVDAAVVAAGFDIWRRVGAVLTNGSLNITPYVQFGDEFVWESKQMDVLSSGQGTGTTSHAVRTPLGINARFKGSINFRESDSDNRRHASTTAGVISSIPSVSHTNMDHDKRGGDNVDTILFMELLTDTSSQIKTRWDSSQGDVQNQIFTHGWVDPRGKDE